MTYPHPLSDSRWCFISPSSPVHSYPSLWLTQFTFSWLISLLRPMLITCLNASPSARQWGQLFLPYFLNHLFRRDSQKCWPQHTTRWGSWITPVQSWQMKRSGTSSMISRLYLLWSLFTAILLWVSMSCAYVRANYTDLVMYMLAGVLQQCLHYYNNCNQSIVSYGVLAIVCLHTRCTHYHNAYWYRYRQSRKHEWDAYPVPCMSFICDCYTIIMHH